MRFLKKIYLMLEKVLILGCTVCVAITKIKSDMLLHQKAVMILISAIVTFAIVGLRVLKLMLKSCRHQPENPNFIYLIIAGISLFFMIINEFLHLYFSYWFSSAWIGLIFSVIAVLIKSLKKEQKKPK